MWPRPRYRHPKFLQQDQSRRRCSRQHSRSYQSGCPMLQVPFQACRTGQRHHRTGVRVVCSSPDYMPCPLQIFLSIWASVRSDPLTVLTRSAGIRNPQQKRTWRLQFVMSAPAEGRHRPACLQIRAPAKLVFPDLEIIKSKNGSDVRSHDFSTLRPSQVASRVWSALASRDSEERIASRTVWTTIRPWASTAERWKLSGKPRLTLRPPPDARPTRRCFRTPSA